MENDITINYDESIIIQNLNKIIQAIRYAEIEFQKDIHVYLEDAEGNRPPDRLSGLGVLQSLLEEKTIDQYLMERLIPLVQYPGMDYKINLSNPDIFEFKIPVLIGNPLNEQKQKILNMNKSQLETFKRKYFGI